MIKTCLLGFGRTGAVIADELLHAPDFQLVSVVSKSGSPKIGHSLSEYLRSPSNLHIVDASLLQQEINAKRFHVAIDFTSPEATLTNARCLAEAGVPMVIGTTGFTSMQIHQLKKLVHQHKIGLVYAPNISVGINLLLSVSKTIARLIPQYDVEVTETNHRYKKDEPSGAAQKIANAIEAIKAMTRSRRWKDRQNNEGNDSVKVHSLRAGGNIGVHRVLFAGEHEELEITHRSYSHTNFAEGALKAAAFIANHHGFFEMEDIFSIERHVRDARISSHRRLINLGV